MKVHEYQARQLMQAAGIPVPVSEVISKPDEARASARAGTSSSIITSSFSQARTIPPRIRSRSKRTRSELFFTTRSGVFSMRS